MLRKTNKFNLSRLNSVQQCFTIFFSNVSCFQTPTYLLRVLSAFAVPPGKVDWGFSKAKRISRCLFIFCFDSEGLTCVKTLSSPISCSNFNVWSDIILIVGFMFVFASTLDSGLPFPSTGFFALWPSCLPLFSLLLFALFLCRDGIQPMMTPLIEGDIYLREESKRKREQFIKLSNMRRTLQNNLHC